MSTDEARAREIVAEAALLYGEVERTVAVEGRCVLHDNSSAAITNLERFRRRQLVRLTTESDPLAREAILVVQLCGLDESGLEQVDRAMIRREVSPQSIVWSLAVSALHPGLMYAVAETDVLADEYLTEMRINHPDDDLRATLIEDSFWLALETRQHDVLASLLDEARAVLSPQQVASMVSRLDRIQALTPGSIAPEFDLAGFDAGDGTLSLGRFRGRYVLMHFWTTWCQPCLEELASLGAAYDAFHERGLEIVSISEDDSPGDVRSFRKEPGHDMPWHHAFVGTAGMAGSVLDLYGVESLPRLLLVAPDGTVAVESSAHLRGQNLFATLATFLGEI